MNTKQISNEMLLLLHCAPLSPSAIHISVIQNLLIAIDNNHSFLVRLAYKHAVFPLLYKTLKRHFPQHPLTIKLKPYYLNIVQTNMSITTELLKSVTLLNTHHIPTLCFKGPLLSALVYGDITLRQYGDLDILIHKKDKDKAMILLKKNAYIPEIKLKKQTKNTFLDAVNVLGFHSPKKDTFIEVHWGLLSKNYAIHWEERDLWKEREMIQIDRHPLETLSHTNHFLYLCVHGSKHLFERLSWVCDIDRYVQTQNDINWEEIFTHAKHLGILRILCLSLHLTHTLLNTPLPKEVEDKISHDALAKKLSQQLIDLQFTNSNTKPKGLYAFKFLWLMRENFIDKLRFTYYALFAAKFDDFKFIQLPNYLAFLYPLVRPLRLAIKYFK